MKNILLLLSCLFFLNISSSACLNGETKELKNGIVIYNESPFNFTPNGHRFSNVNQKLANELGHLYQTTKDIDYLSDKGYVLIVLGKYEEAIHLYLSIENTHPSRYSTASNIGTAYELTGQNELALKWIKKAILLNPNSHEASEWIHVKILEAKINDKDLNDGSGFLIDFGQNAKPNSPLSIDSLNILRHQLVYQLNERMSFVKPKDKIVAALLFDLANICYLLNPKSKQDDFYDGKEAIKNYNNAIRYGYSNIIIKDRIEVANGKKPKPRPVIRTESKSNLWIYSVVGSVILALFLFLFLKSKKVYRS